MKVLSVSLNTFQTVLCEKYYKNDSGLIGNDIIKKGFQFTKRNDCYNPTFFAQVEHYIARTEPQMVVIATEGDLETGTYFHSDFLPDTMKQYGYHLFRREKYEGGMETIRISVYIDDRNKNNISYIGKKTLQCKTSRALGVYVTINKVILAFIAGAFNTEEDCYDQIKPQLLDNQSLIDVIIMMGYPLNLQYLGSYKTCKEVNPYAATDRYYNTIVYDVGSGYIAECVDYQYLKVLGGNDQIKNHNPAMMTLKIDSQPTTPQQSNTMETLRTQTTNQPDFKQATLQARDQQSGFTGIEEIDQQIMQQMDYLSLFAACSTTKLASRICQNSDFWISKFENDDLEIPISFTSSDKVVHAAIITYVLNLLLTSKIVRFVFSVNSNLTLDRLEAVTSLYGAEIYNAFPRPYHEDILVVDYYKKTYTFYIIKNMEEKDYAVTEYQLLNIFFDLLYNELIVFWKLDDEEMKEIVRKLLPSQFDKKIEGHNMYLF